MTNCIIDCKSDRMYLKVSELLETTEPEESELADNNILVSPLSSEDITSTGWLGTYSECEGTSIAVPHAVGVASLLWQKDITKSADYIRKLMLASSKTITNESGNEYSYIDYDYACKIYDEFNEQYIAGNDIEQFCNEHENSEEVEDYTDDVEARWSKKNHVTTATEAYNLAGGLSSSELAIVKVGVRTPDVWYPADFYDGTSKNPWNLDLRMFHAITKKYNYLKVFEYIMNMALKCKKKGIDAAQNMNYPDNSPGDYNECAYVKAQLTKGCITNILKGMTGDKIYNYKYTDKRVSLIMLGFAMHIVGDTYSHRAYVNKNGTYKLPNDWPKKDKDINNTDNTTFCKSRFDSCL